MKPKYPRIPGRRARIKKMRQIAHNHRHIMIKYGKKAARDGCIEFTVLIRDYLKGDALLYWDKIKRRMWLLSNVHPSPRVSMTKETEEVVEFVISK